MQRCVVAGWLLWAFVGAQIVFPDSNSGGNHGSSGFDPCRLCPCNGGSLNIPCPSSCCSNSINRPIPNTPRPSVNRPSSCSAGCFQCFRPGQGQVSCGSGCCRNNFIQPTVAPVQQTCPAGCFQCNVLSSVQDTPCFSGNGCCRRVQGANVNQVFGGADVDQMFGGGKYHFSWLHDGNQKYTQQQAANYCARLPGGWRIISIETRDEDNFVNNIIATNRLDYIWTGATRTSFGWRWPSGSAFQPINWSTTGGFGVPQPDNREPGGENCLAVLNNVYDDGVKWHDIGCHHPKPTICER